jgi:hypothetical protein
MTGINLDALADAIREQPRPPCDSCAFSHECTLTEKQCPSFRAYVETCQAVRPPRKRPKG